MPLMVLEEIFMKTPGRPVGLKLPIFKVIFLGYPGN